MTEQFTLMIKGAQGSGESLTVSAPWDGSEIAQVPYACSADIELALATAHKIFSDRKAWLPKPERLQILEKTAALMQQQKEWLAIEAAREGGKPLLDSRVEVTRAIDGIKSCIEVLRTDSGQEIPMGLNAASMQRLAFTHKEPIGVVVAISAFNHPLNLIVHQVGPAIAAGCPVIVKPAEDTPLSCMRFIKLLREAGLPEAYCQGCVVKDHSLAERLVSDTRVAFLSFIGSAKVGWMLRSKLAPGARCALEHGGVAPVIIEQSADLEDTLPLIAKGGFYHAGQVCVSVQRVYAPKAMAEDVAQRLANLAQTMSVGDPTLEVTDVGPLIRTHEVTRVAEWVDEAMQSGAQCMCGGHVLSASTYACTVLLNPSTEDAVSQKEIFGPVICVYGYDCIDSAIKQANSLPYAFQASVLTQNIDVAMYCSQQLDAATVMVNDHTSFRVDWMPFAGLKQSGLGVGGIPYTFEDMQVDKQIVIRSKQII